MKENDSLSPATLQQHFETFLRTYVPTHGRKGEAQEDKAYPKALKKYGVKNIFLFAECCHEVHLSPA